MSVGRELGFGHTVRLFGMNSVEKCLLVVVRAIGWESNHAITIVIIGAVSASPGGLDAKVSILS